MPAFGTLSAEMLARLIGTPEAPVVIDVRVPEDFDADPRLIPTALRIAHESVPELAAGIGERRAVVFRSPACRK